MRALAETTNIRAMRAFVQRVARAEVGLRRFPWGPVGWDWVVLLAVAIGSDARVGDELAAECGVTRGAILFEPHFTCLTKWARGAHFC